MSRSSLPSSPEVPEAESVVGQTDTGGPSETAESVTVAVQASPTVEDNIPSTRSTSSSGSVSAPSIEATAVPGKGLCDRYFGVPGGVKEVKAPIFFCRRSGMTRPTKKRRGIDS